MRIARNLFIMVIFVSIIFAVPLFTMLKPFERYSFFENRALAKRPVLTRAGLASGGYFRDWDTYLSDHLVWRDRLLYDYTFINAYILDRKVVNNIVLTKNALLPFFPYTVPNKDEIAASSRRMVEKLTVLNRQIEAYGGAFYYVGIPEQSSMLRQFYPSFLYNNDSKLNLVEKSFFTRLKKAGINHLDMREVFLTTRDYTRYYSRDDHHYNMYGAFLTYQEIIGMINKDGKYDVVGLDTDDVRFIKLANPFYGSRNRIIYNVYSHDDKLVICQPDSPVEFIRYDNDSKVKAEVYKLPATKDESVTYNVFMGGDIPETVIETNRPQLPTLLVFGDSFTNPLEGLLYTGFDRMVSLDLRYYNEKSLRDYIAEYQPDIVLCIRDDLSYLLPTGNGDFQ